MLAAETQWAFSKHWKALRGWVNLDILPLTACLALHATLPLVTFYDPVMVPMLKVYCLFLIDKVSAWNCTDILSVTLWLITMYSYKEETLVRRPLLKHICCILSPSYWVFVKCYRFLENWSYKVLHGMRRVCLVLHADWPCNNCMCFTLFPCLFGKGIVVHARQTC